MKKIILPFIFSFMMISGAFSQERYIDEVFANFTVDSSIVYSTNLSVLAASQGFPYVPTGSNGIPALAFDKFLNGVHQNFEDLKFLLLFQQCSSSPIFALR